MTSKSRLGNLTATSRCHILALLMACSGAMPLKAEEWVYSGSGDWFTPENWSGTFVPLSTTDVVIATGTTVRIDATGAVSRNAALSNAGGLEVSGTGSSWTLSGSLSMANVDFATSRLDIINGAVVTVGGGKAVGVATNLNSQGTLRVSGGGSELRLTGSSATVAGDLNIGQRGYGELQIENGGAVKLAGNVLVGATGTMGGSVQVSGTGSVLEAGGNMTMGFFGPTSLLIKDGGSVTVGNTLYLKKSQSAELGYSTDMNIGSYDRTSTGGTLNVDKIVFQEFSGSGAIYFNQTDSTTLAADISGRVSVVQRGFGTTTLTGSSTYSGNVMVPFPDGPMPTTLAGTLVQSGTLIVQGSEASVSHTAADLVVSGTEGSGPTFIAKGGATVTASNVFVSTGSGTLGNLNVESGAQMLFTESLAVGANGTMRISGTGTMVHSTTNSRPISIGGTLQVEDGAHVSTTEPIHIQMSGTGSLLISGPGSEWFSEGNMDFYSESGTQSITIANAATLTTGSNSSLNLGSEVGGTIVLNIGEYDGTSTAGMVQTGTIRLNSSSAVINFNQRDSIDFSSEIVGNGTLIQRGSGTTTINTPIDNFFSNNNRIVSNGTLKIEGDEIYLRGTTHVQDTGVLHLGSGIVAYEVVTMTGDQAVFRKDFGESENLTGMGTLVSTSADATRLQLLAGTANTATTLDVSFLSTPSEITFNDLYRLSDVVDISGTGDTVFVMQLSYTQEAYNAAALAGLFASETELHLGYLDGNEWVSAGDGPFIIGGWSSSFLTVGTYGVDTSNNVVWAVLDHNSEYAVIPEPSALILLGLGLGGLIALRRYKRKAADTAASPKLQQ